MTTSARDIRETFLRYFESHGHMRIRSSALIPQNDPTLLFINAGMNQFKDVFLGKAPRPAPCATTVQKCMRVSGKHNDLENVGRTARHHTFFEMLGNFSFGDYFKQRAIHQAWELMVDVMKLPPERLWVTVFREDDEAYDIWAKEIGVREDRIVRMGEKSNFWQMGDTGPCGPCTEIHIDQGEGPNGIWKNEDIFGDSDRFLELWNLVFMQYNRQPDGKLLPLPKPSVDTGAGLERLVAVKQGVLSNYETDLFQPIIQKCCRMSGKTYHANPEDDVSLQVVADHCRAATFVIGDGQLPSNEHRGYVMRRIMRRAIRHGKRLGFESIFMPELCQVVIDEMGAQYPELQRGRDFILKVVGEEEKSFRQTLSTGLDLLGEAMGKLDTKKETIIPGEVAFKLYDTYGFPLDLTEVIAAEKGKTVDTDGFNAEMEKQRARGRSSWKGTLDANTGKLYAEVAEHTIKRVEFVGYDTLTAKGEVAAIIAHNEICTEAHAGTEVEFITKLTPFYAEGGGQVGDVGLATIGPQPTGEVGEWVTKLNEGAPVEYDGELLIVINDTQKPLDGLYVHKGRVVRGSLRTGQELTLAVDAERRMAIRSNHSATHLLQYALRRILGSHVKQSGSFVSPERLRFDFTHFSAVTPEQIEEVERLVNAKVRACAPVDTQVKSLEQAQREGAIAFFGEKYGETVRVVTMTSDSVELCGGTHVDNTGRIGIFKVVAESSIASGVRRIEAATGAAALALVQQNDHALTDAAGVLSVAKEQVVSGLVKLAEDEKAARKQIERLKRDIARLESAALLQQVEEINGVRVLCVRVNELDAKAMRDYAQEVMDKLGRGVLCLAAPAGDKLNVLLGVSEEYRGKLPAGNLIRDLAALAGGRGGGRADMAQAGGFDPAKLDDVFAALRERVRQA